MRRGRAIWTKVEEPADVRVLLPYTKPTETLQTVVDCLRIQFVQPEIVKVGNDDGYWTMLRDAWAEGQEFFVVEQDVLVWPGAIHILRGCAEDWCTLPTLCHGKLLHTTFGCVKFGQQLIERNPGIWNEIAKDWCWLDARFAETLGWPFILPHPHYPVAAHMNEVQWPDSISRRFDEEKQFWQSVEEGGPILWTRTKEANSWQMS